MKVLDDYLMYFTSAEKRLFYNKWLRPVTSAEFRQGAELVHNHIKKGRVELWLLDASNCNTQDRDDQEWTVSEIGKLISGEEALLRKVALVRSKDVFFNVIAEWIQEKLTQQFAPATVMKHFQTLPEAYEWLLPEHRICSTSTEPPFINEPRN
ncbi:STAS/SEC14 domain-containing protein [Pontibacter ruber]|uniref:STAS/SEC14 domain-containing protein n=1 Tax=Pontibacter ruber TaxID=1343895 RepID=A0ABW5CYS0_9BACT|nr:STAS/SEC14 domain-containing protein [Pontibacter ruber]